MNFRYYIQQEPKGVRRYAKDIAERWDSGGKKWTKHCATEESCILTKDKKVSESEAVEFIKSELKGTI